MKAIMEAGAGSMAQQSQARTPRSSFTMRSISAAVSNFFSAVRARLTDGVCITIGIVSLMTMMWHLGQMNPTGVVFSGLAALTAVALAPCTSKHKEGGEL